MSAPKSLEPPWWVWALYFLTWFIGLLPAIAYPVEMMGPSTFHLTRASLPALFLFGMYTLMGIAAVVMQGQNKERNKFRRKYSQACASKHPIAWCAFYLVVDPFFPLATLLIGVMWLFTNSLVLAAISAGVALLIKLAAMVIAWAWGSIMAGLPMLVFEHGLKAVMQRVRRRSVASEGASRRPIADDSPSL